MYIFKSSLDHNYQSDSTVTALLLDHPLKILFRWGISSTMDDNDFWSACSVADSCDCIHALKAASLTQGSPESSPGNVCVQEKKYALKSVLQIPNEIVAGKI